MRFIKKYQRKITALIDTRWKRVKLAAERFVLKTIKKHGLSSSEGIARSCSVGVAGANQYVEQVSGFGANRFMYAYLKANQRQIVAPRTSLQAVAVGNGMMLVGHPHLGFMFADAMDVVQLPRLVMNNYQERTTIALERSIGSGDFVLHFGAQQGYHLLTISQLVGPTGLIVAIESSKDFDVLKINVESHTLESRVKLVGDEIQNYQSLALLNPPSKNCVVFVPEGCQLHPLAARSLVEFLKTNSLVTIIDGTRVTSSEEFVAKLLKTILDSSNLAA